MAEIIDSSTYPPGWECKFDRRTGKQYYINYLTKMTTWDDPRIRCKQNQGPQNYPVDYVTQPGHGSPYHVYPYPSPVPLQHAFQPPPYPSAMLHSTYSPKALPKQIMQELGGRSNGSPLSGGSPILGRGISLTPKGSPLPNRIYSPSNKLQDSSITLAVDTDASVVKISSMFPTVSETHIRILLKKYYNREAVVISALQVEKHPISTPGPFSTPPAGASRLQATAAGICAGVHLARAAASPTPPLGTSPRASPPLRPGSGASGTFIGSPRSASRPHSSPKMKLRYLKSVFPKAEETLILDMLASEENNVQRTSEKLLAMGYFKRETVPPRLPSSQKESDPPKPPPPPVTPPRLKSIEEKKLLKGQLQKKYSNIPERVVSIALESVDWSESRAEQILSVVVQEDVINNKVKETLQEIQLLPENRKDTSSANTIAALSTPSPVQVPPQLIESPSNGKSSREPNHLDKTNRRHKNKKETAKAMISSPSDSDKCFKSKYLTKARGPNSLLVKGAQDQLLLVDYITWNGANPDLKTGSSILTKGSIKSRDGSNESYSTQTRGVNKDMYSGPSGLAKGSMIYQHINKAGNLPQMKVGGE